jgi:hypothetical protein
LIAAVPAAAKHGNGLRRFVKPSPARRRVSFSRRRHGDAYRLAVAGTATNIIDRGRTGRG